MMYHPSSSEKMFKNRIGTFIVIAFSLTFMPVVITAQERALETTDLDIVDTIQLENRPEPPTETATERRENREEIRQERRATLQQALQNRFLNLVDNVSNRIEAASLRLSNISERLESRLAKLETAGIDTSTPKATLAAAQTKLTDAQNTLAAAKATAHETLRGETAREDFGKVKVSFKNTTEELREAFRLLRQVVAETKAAVAQEANEQGVRSAVSNLTNEGEPITE